jgi:hypothetical protein
MLLAHSVVLTNLDEQYETLHALHALHAPAMQRVGVPQASLTRGACRPAPGARTHDDCRLAAPATVHQQ